MADQNLHIHNPRAAKNLMRQQLKQHMIQLSIPSNENNVLLLEEPKSGSYESGAALNLNSDLDLGVQIFNQNRINSKNRSREQPIKKSNIGI